MTKTKNPPKPKKNTSEGKKGKEMNNTKTPTHQPKDDAEPSFSDQVPVPPPPPEKARRIRLMPNQYQKEELLKWMGAARWTYNECLRAIRREKSWTMGDLRARFINNKKSKVVKSRKWLRHVPYDVRDEGLRDLDKAIKACKAKGGRFEIGFRTRKDHTQSMVMHKKHWEHVKGRYVWLRHIPSAEPIPRHLDHDCRIIRNKRGEWYFCMPLPLDKRGENQAPQFQQEEIEQGAGVVALDLGVRTFQTTFNNKGEIHHWGPSDMSRIHRLCYHYDQLQSKWNAPEVKHRNRRKMKIAGRRIQGRIQNLVRELHCKLVNWLCANHRLILLPEFRVQRMVTKHTDRGRRKITGKTAKAMLTWSHYKFKQRLLHKAREYPWTRVMIVNEAYTSKTCGLCGNIHHELEGNKVFECPSCGWVVDRDVNGSRNILLRTLATLSF